MVVSGWVKTGGGEGRWVGGGGWEVGGGLGGVWWHTMLEAGGQTCRSASSPIAAGMASSTQEASARLVVCCVCVWPL